MKKLKEHIFYKILALVLAMVLLVPTAVKFSHIFAHHKHDICKGEKTTHLHEINPDCDFYKFKLAQVYTFTLFNFELFSVKENHTATVSKYQFLSEFQQLQTLLRGPPHLV
ncbi:hypothetical protein [Mariniflexile maritimum]|uniref:hypothetical protein n=1 Tax=Mariniflexile maritimum TaxID=2682493 RepID=UPI0012F64E53|nr:hypothetical protein [Mariniflexile maritimum]